MFKEVTFTPQKVTSVQANVSLKNHFWVTARGKKISVTQMTTNHIKNCINCLNGVGNMVIPDGYLGGKIKWLKIFEEELANRN